MYTSQASIPLNLGVEFFEVKDLLAQRRNDSGIRTEFCKVLLSDDPKVFVFVVLLPQILAVFRALLECLVVVMHTYV